jgi:hypothetical protein
LAGAAADAEHFDVEIMVCGSGKKCKDGETLLFELFEMMCCLITRMQRTRRRKEEGAFRSSILPAMTV